MKSSKRSEIGVFQMGLTLGVVVATIVGAIVVSTIGCSGGDSGGNKGGEKSLYEQLQAARDNPDAVSKADDMIRIANLYVKSADLQGAKNALNDATEAAEGINAFNFPADRARVHIRLAGAWKAAGKSRECDRAFEEAEDALEKIENAADKTTIFTEIAELQIKLEQPGNAADALKSAEESAEDIEDPYERVDLLAEVAEVYAKMDKSDEASRVLQVAVTLAESQDTPDKKSAMLAVVASKQATALDNKDAGLATLGTALELARSIQDNPNLKANRLVDVARGYKEVGQKAKTREILTEAEDLVRGRSEGQPLLDEIEKLRQGL